MTRSKQTINNIADTLTLDAKLSKAAVQSISLDTLKANGQGFKISGATFSYTGTSVGFGDINGDGFSDMIVGAPGDAYGVTKGAAYVVFGKAGGFINKPTGQGNFKFSAADSINVGRSVSSAGDVNGDGINDLLVGATGSIFADNAGEAYVIFGKHGLNSINLAAGQSLSAAQGFKISGGSIKTLAYSVSGAGDINGDGFDDIVVGAVGTYAKQVPGVAYVVFGAAGISNVDVGNLNGSNGFAFTSVTVGDTMGASVSQAGDINGDGYDDLIIGTPFADVAANNSGAAYVLFGKAEGFSNLTTADLNGSNGFTISGAGAGSYSGTSVSSAGDINGDGFSDLIVDAKYAASAYVIFGKSDGFSQTLNVSTLNGADGFKISGDALSKFGDSVSSAGDVNGDGYGDLIIGATSGTGSAYVLFGKAGGFSDISTADINGANGFKLSGAASGDLTGISVSSAGDINKDGFDDMIVGASGVNGKAGAAYAIFGKDFNDVVDYAGTAGKDKLVGTSAAETFVGGRDNDVLVGNGGADAFHGGGGNDVIQVSDLSFREVDGGASNDKLALTGKNLNLNLASEHGKITGIEVIGLTGSGNNTLTLTAHDVLNLSDTQNSLTVLGNAGDHVVGISTANGWAHDANQGNFQHFHNGQAVVLVGLAVDVAFI